MLTQNAVLHENWTGNVAEGYDVGLLRLDRVSTHVPAGLPTSIDAIRGGQRLVALGWGREDDGDNDDLQQAASIEFVRNDFCRLDEFWGDVIKDSMLCAFGFDGGQEVCQGDSGGPLLDAFAPDGNITAGNPALDVVVGITSFGEESPECGEANLPSVFTKLSRFRSWIDETTGVTSRTGSRPPEDPADDSPDIVQSAAEPSSLLESPTPSPSSGSPRENQQRLDQKLWEAAIMGDIKTVNMAIADGADVNIKLGSLGSTPLYQAASKGHVDIVMELLRAGANVDLATDSSSATPLFVASQNGHLEVVVRLLSAGADVNKQRALYGDAPLFMASQNGHLEVVEALIEAGADPNKATARGNGPLGIAAQNGHYGIVTALLKAGTDPGVRNDEGATPLHKASLTLTRASARIGKALLAAGAEIDGRDFRDQTPLIWAAKFGNFNMTRFLLREGADRSITDDDGETAMDKVCSCLETVLVFGGVPCPEGGCEKGKTKRRIRDLLI